jgi:hypothetical protein
MPEICRFDEKVTNIELDEEENPEILGTGLSEGTVTRVHGSIEGAGGRTREIALAEKSFLLEDTASQEEYIRKILAKHQELKKRGLPTIPTMRIGNIDGQNKLLMTDLSQGGQNEVLSDTDWETYKDKRGKYYESEKKFKISNSKDLSQKAADVFRQLVIKGCIAHNDVFFLVINKETGIAGLLLGDLHGVKFYSDNSFKEYSSSVDLLEENYAQINEFIDRLNEHLDKESQIDLSPIKQTRDELVDGIQNDWKTNGDTSEI